MLPSIGEDVGSHLRKIGSCFARGFRFIDWLVLPAAGESEQYRHRAIIDMPLVNRVARKFLTHVARNYRAIAGPQPIDQGRQKGKVSRG